MSSNGHSGSFGEFDEEEEEEDDPHRVPEVFVAGVYQAVYDFEPELETEMRMTTGDVVSVWERQCDGWVSNCFLSAHTRRDRRADHANRVTRFKLRGWLRLS